MSRLTRRAVLLAGGAMAMMGAALSPRALASPGARQPLFWRDASLPSPGEAVDALLGPELVGQWRNELRGQLHARALSVTALVRWDKAMVLPGLAREEGWKSRTHRVGPGVFRVDVIV